MISSDRLAAEPLGRDCTKGTSGVSRSGPLWDVPTSPAVFGVLPHGKLIPLRGEARASMRRAALAFLALALTVSALPFLGGSSAAGPTKIRVGPNIDISNLPAVQAEASIVINPNNPSQVVAGSNDRSTVVPSVDAAGVVVNLSARAYFSADGGATWENTAIPRPPLIPNSSFSSEGDPGVAWDTRGHVYFSHVVFFLTSSGAIVGAEIGVGKSSDGGRTWTVTYVGFATGQNQSADKPMIAVDTNVASPFRDTVYVVWVTDLGPPGLLVSHSTDFGATWSAPISPTGQAPAGGFNQAPFSPDPFVGPDGTLYVAWQDEFGSRIAVVSSADEGQSFGSATAVGPVSSLLAVLIPAQNERGVLFYPACGADTSTGPNRGTLYCSWMNTVPSSTTYVVTDIFEAHSTDHGQTWSAPVRVNDDPPAAANDHFNQWLSVDPTDGSVSMSWDDTRNDPTHVSTDIFYALSTDGGMTFSPNVQVTTASTNVSKPCCSNDVLSAQYADYAGIAAFGGVVHPVWTDMRASVSALKQEIFTATITVKPS